VFLGVGAVILISALLVVTSRNLVHAALWLIVSLFGVAVFYVLLNAGFLAVAQVVIYIGAIAILVIFAVMMTQRLVKEPPDQFNRNWLIAGLVVTLLFVGLVFIFTGWDGSPTEVTALTNDGGDTLQMLGLALVSPNLYLLPFELVSVLLLAAMIGAIIVAWEKQL
jgi:NADH-quinone oxidoreductase subunit J